MDVTVTTAGGTGTTGPADRYTYTPDTSRLVAGPILLSIQPGQVGLTLKLSATLTDTVTGQPAAGETISCSVGGRSVCTAVTDPHGTATCHGLGGVVAALLTGRYTATFAGTQTLAPATAVGGGI